MSAPKLAGSSLMALFQASESDRSSIETNSVLVAETANDAPFAALAYANLVVFTALLFSLAGLNPYWAVGYSFFAFLILAITAASGALVRNFAISQGRSRVVVASLTLNELALTSILVFDFLAPERADGIVAIVSVVSISFLSVPLFARFLRSFLLIKLGVMGLCCLYAMTTPFNQIGVSIALAALVIAYLSIAAMGYWIVTRRREEIRLRAELTRMNFETEKAQVQAKADFDLRQRLLSYIGHDLRQPISAARFVLHNLSAQHQAPEAKGLVNDAQECIQSAGRMIEDIVQITHYNSPDIEVLPEPVSLTTVLTQCGREYAAASNPSGAQLRCVQSSIRVNIDPEILTRILRNLLRNARMHANANYVLLGVRRRAAGVEIWVVDDGRGIESSNAAGESTGLGIGLEISSQLAKACGATLEIVSAKNKGTNCRLKIPKTLIL